MKIEIEKSNLVAAYNVAAGNVKQVLLTMFGKDAVMPDKPDYSDYHNIKTMDDVFAATGCNKEEFEKKLADLPEDVQAFMLLRLIRKALNPTWIPNWADTDEYKYFPYFSIEIPAGVGSASYGSFLGVSCLYSNGVASSSRASYGGALASENREIAIWFGEHFAEIWKGYLLANVK